MTDHTYITCKDCPDRTASPNCHTTCEGYKYRMDKYHELKEKKGKEDECRVYETVRSMRITERMRRSNSKK